MLVKRLRPLPIEAVVRGYLAGSGWHEYQKSRSVCGVPLPAGLKNASRLPEPIFTPASKAEAGDHDENIAICVNNSPLPGMPWPITTSNALKRSVATISMRSVPTA